MAGNHQNKATESPLFGGGLQHWSNHMQPLGAPHSPAKTSGSLRVTQGSEGSWCLTSHKKRVSQAAALHEGQGQGCISHLRSLTRSVTSAVLQVNSWVLPLPPSCVSDSLIHSTRSSLQCLKPGHNHRALQESKTRVQTRVWAESPAK